ncbi:MAG: DUF480 domain-containing protein [Planctomycetia bacterium]|nr:DUF480 domain-containing protein [Planctomycetia bacterium]
MSSESPTTPAAIAPRWQPVSAVDRRVLGVLVEKAKTTPDAYPLSLNALVTGCNQKNNRYPVTQLEAEDVEQSLDRLRALGAVAAVQAGGRVEKYRHYMYEWLGVEKLELAVMAELLLRGAQTEGELRGRAARMDPIPDLTALRPVVESLMAKGLVEALSPEGRGRVLTHTLYLPEEMERTRREHGGGSSHGPGSAETRAESFAPRPTPHTAPVAGGGVTDQQAASVRRELDELRASLAQLRADLSELAAHTESNTAALERLRQSLGE